MGQQRQSDAMCSEVLTLTVAQFVTDGCTVRLFRNDHVPGAGDTAGSYTEANFSGYSPISFTDWGSVTVSSNVASVSAGSKVFTHDGGATNNDIYGAYVTRDTDNALLFAQRDDSPPFAMNGGGKSYTVTPLITYHSEFP